MDTTLVASDFWQFDTSILKLATFHEKLLLLSLMLLDLLLKHIGDRLIS